MHHNLQIDPPGAHLREARVEVEGADISGLFPTGSVANMPTVVVDANVLRNDILYACRTGRRTTLVNAANAGLIRLFCTGHVAQEVLDHHRRWSIEGKLSARALTEVWIHEYAPLLHLIPNPPEGLLTDAEQARLTTLRTRDRDDIPSAALALILGAFYLSEDGPATEAVYGERRPNDQLRAWRAALSAGGDAGAIALGMNATALLVGVMRIGVVELAAVLPSGAPRGLLLAAAAGAGGYRIRKADPDSRQRLLNAFKNFAAFSGAVALEHVEAIAKLDRVYAPDPDPANVAARAMRRAHAAPGGSSRLGSVA